MRVRKQISEGVEEILPGRANNPIIYKNQIGKPQPSSNPLPHIHHVYGKEIPQNQMTIKNIVSQWQYSQKSKHTGSEIRDFHKLNLMSTRNKQISCKEMTEFRKVQDAKLKIKLGQKKQFPLPDIYTTFGKATRVSTPIKGIMKNNYGRQIAQEHQNRYRQVWEEQNAPRANSEIRYNQKTVEHFDRIKAKYFLSPDSSPKKSLENFTLKRFQNISPRVSIPKLPKFETPKVRMSRSLMEV